MNNQSSDMLRGPAQEFDFGSDAEEEDEPPAPLLRGRKSKQGGPAPHKIVPTSSGDSSDSESEDERTTMANMEARSRALDAQAAAEAELDIEEFQGAAAAAEDEDEDDDMEGEEDANGDIDAEPFHLPTPAEREEEKLSVPDVHTVQRRMRECVRILGKFKRLAAEGQSVFFSYGLTSLGLTLFSAVHARITSNN